MRYANEKYVDNDIVKLKLFPFSLRDRVNIWFSSLPRNSIDSWDKCKDAFITKYFSSTKIYAGLNFVSRNLLDSAAGDTCMEITLGEATKLLDNIMANYSQWHTERAPTSKKVNLVEEINSLSEKVDALVKLVANKNAPIDLNDVPLSTLIEQNSDAVDVNFVSRNNFNNNAYRGNFNPRPFLGNSSNNYGNSYGNQSYNNNNRNTSDLENNIKEFINTQNVFNATIEENLSKIDDMSRSIDRISHDVENLKMKIFVPKVDESIKPLYVSMDESNNRTAMLRAKREFLERAFSSDYYHKSDEDLKVIGVSYIDSLLLNLRLIKKGLEKS